MISSSTRSGAGKISSVTVNGAGVCSSLPILKINHIDMLGSVGHVAHREAKHCPASDNPLKKVAYVVISSSTIDDVQ